MSREKEGYRDQLEVILQHWPDKDCLHPSEVAEFCGCTRHTAVKLFHFIGTGRAQYITRANLAREMCK